MPVPLAPNNQQSQHPQRQRTMPSKTVKHKSSKPIINWLQRKLGGSVRARRASDPTLPVNIPGARATYTARSGSRQTRATVVRDVDENGYAMRSAHRPFSNEISLNSTEDYSDEVDDESNRRSSGAAVSMWGSRSNPLEADEDASIRPLPPTSPPSPSPSRSSSSYISSNSRTFQSITASTKPTTLLSIDLNPSAVAHIAQAPSTPTSATVPYNTPGPSPVARLQPHVRSGSNNGPGGIGLVTFSALPPFSPPSSRPPSLGPAGRIGIGALQAPSHTTHHPRNNPRPSSPPLDNASILTLASSAYALTERARGAAQPPYTWTADSLSHISHGNLGGDSVSQIAMDGDFADEQNASIRALRPRSARRDSWESESSHWSAGVSFLGALAGRDRSVVTAPSFRTGGQYTIDADDNTSISLADEDNASIREGVCDEVDADKEGLRSEEDRALSPLSALSIEEVSEEQSAEVSHETSTEALSQTSNSSLKVTPEIEDLSTPGPAGRTLVLAPSFEKAAIEPVHTDEKRPITPPTSAPSKEVELTPRKEGITA